MKSGTIVKLKALVKERFGKGISDNETAKIDRILLDIKGGLKLDRTLAGCLYWNINDVEVVHEVCVNN